MSKRNRHPGVGNRFDFGESGYMDNLRKRAETEQKGRGPNVGTRICSRCRAHRPIKGGRFVQPFRRFVCRACNQ
jgi:hypothetical protein